MFRKHLYLEHLCTMASISLIEKDSIVPTRHSFKNYVLACKISNQMHTNFEEREVPQAVSGNFVKKWLSVGHVLYNIFFFICGQNSCKTRLKKFILGLFQGKFTFTWKCAISITVPLHQIFEKIFLRTRICSWWK